MRKRRVTSLRMTANTTVNGIENERRIEKRAERAVNTLMLIVLPDEDRIGRTIEAKSSF